jgi:hypothetical protein
MNRTWFSIKVKFSRPDEDGIETKVTEEYLIDAYSYTEAETRMYQIIADDLGTAAEVSTISRNNFAEVLRFAEGDPWWKAKVTLISFDEESGKEKQSNQSLLVQASDIKDAYDKLNKQLGKGTLEFLIPTISFSKIVEVYDWDGSSEERAELERQGYKPVKKSKMKHSEEFEE